MGSRVGEFTGVFNLCWDACESFEPAGAGHGGEVGSAHAGEDDAVQVGGKIPEFGDFDVPLCEIDASAHGTLDRCGLFGDFFVHEVRVVADVGEAALGLQGYGDFVDRGPDDADDLDFIAVYSDGFAVVDVDDFFDVGRHRGGVAG